MPNDQGLDISIEYCAECGYYPRVAWLLGEVMGDIQHDVKRVTIIPSGGGRHEGPRCRRFGAVVRPSRSPRTR